MRHPNIIEFKSNFVMVRDHKCWLGCELHGLLLHLHHLAPGSFVHPQDGTMHIVMEYAAGGTLHDFLCNQEGKLLSEDTIWEIFVQIASAVKYMHQCNILHRDLKTANILIMGDVRSASSSQRQQPAALQFQQ